MQPLSGPSPPHHHNKSNSPARPRSKTERIDSAFNPCNPSPAPHHHTTTISPTAPPAPVPKQKGSIQHSTHATPLRPSPPHHHNKSNSPARPRSKTERIDSAFQPMQTPLRPSPPHTTISPTAPPAPVPKQKGSIQHSTHATPLRPLTTTHHNKSNSPARPPFQNRKDRFSIQPMQPLSGPHTTPPQ